MNVNSNRRYVWRAFDHEGEVLEAVSTKRRNKAAALKLVRKLMKCHGKAEELAPDPLASYRAALRGLAQSLSTCFPTQKPTNRDASTRLSEAIA